MTTATIDQLSQKLQQRITGKSLILPLLPQVASQVLSLVNDPDSDAAALSQLIQGDQALAGHVMRIANSAAYSPAAQMSSLQQAIARLGMQTIAEIAMAATLGPNLFQAQGFEALIRQMWQESLATAVWSREIARQLRRNVESAFLCGLLSQIGRPVVLQTVLAIAKQEGVSVDEQVVIELMRRYQVLVGSMLADHWQLPVAVRHTINGVDNAGPAEGSQPVVEVVRAARIFAVVTTTDQHYEVAVLGADPLVMAVNLYPEDVALLLEKIDAIHDTIKALTV